MEEILTLLDNTVNQIKQLFETFSSEHESTFDEIETKVRQIMLEIERQTTETIIKNRGTGYSGKIIQTPSGEKARYLGERQR
jgi:hypothetical protein